MKRNIFGSWALCAAALLLGGAGCVERETPQPAPPLPVVAGLESRVIVARPGETVTLTARMTDQSGAAFEPYSFDWLAQIHKLEGGLDVASDGVNLCSSPSVTASPEPGVRTLSFPAMQRGICMIQARIHTCGGIRDQPCIDTKGQDFGPVYVHVAGGQTDLVAPLQPSVTLVVGETRALDAIPMVARDADGLRYPSGEALALRVLDTSVAVVEPGQKVRAVATGSTEVELSAGVAKARIPLTVREGAPGLPPDGRHRLETVHFSGLSPDATDKRDEPVSLSYPVFSPKHRLALDPTGAPSAVFEMSAVGVQWAGVMLAEWSGSGFGVQTVGPWQEQLFQPRLAIDERGTRHVAFQSNWDLRTLVATRGAQSGADGWRLQVLPRRLELSEGEESPSSWALGGDADFKREPIAILAREGGGAFVAYVLWGVDDDPEAPCLRILRLATVTESGVVAEDLERLRFKNWSLDCEDAALSQGLVFRDLEIRRSESGGLEVLLAFERGDDFVVRVGEETWAGIETLAPLAKHTVQGRDVIDDPSPVFPRADAASLEEIGREKVLGWGSDAERMTFLTNYSGNRIDLLTVTPPRPARDGADDREGARLGDLITNQTLRLAPYALPSGAVILDAGARQKSPLEGFPDGSCDTVSGLWRSESPGAVWAKIAAPVPHEWWSAPSAFFELDGALFGTQNVPATADYVLVRSTDGGRSWSEEQGLGSSLARSALIGRTLVFLTHQPVAGADGGRPTEVGLFRLADLGDPESQVEELMARIPVPDVRYAKAQEWIALVAEPDGVVVMTELDPEPRLGRLTVRRLGLDGSVRDTNVSGERAYLSVDLRTAVRAGDGSLVAFRRNPTTNGFSIVAHRSGDLFRTEEAVTLEGEWWEPLHSVTLKDGRIAVAAGRWLSPGRVQAAYSVSADGGRTWSEPKAIRPGGGMDQRVWGLAATAEGGLVAVMGDNGLMRANPDGDQVVDGVAVRVEAP